MPEKLIGKVALVTGSSRGIGRAIAVKLASEGAFCVLTGRDRDALAMVSGETGAPSLAIDLRESAAGQRLVDFALERYGRLDIVVNNAGATKRGEFVSLSDEDWLDGFALKFFGAVRVTRAAWPHLKAAHGSVLNIAGAGGRTPGPLFSIGGSVNAALMAFTKSLADTGVADGVQVNTVNPGVVRTGRMRRRLSDLAARQRIDLSAAEQHLVAEENIVRVGEPEEIAELVNFIVGPHGRFIHGSLIDMDGGATKAV
jgi:NAD(P)-dependent dehydrogenase (short-subunit alcohol dehydrogenase family)